VGTGAAAAGAGTGAEGGATGGTGVTGRWAVAEAATAEAGGTGKGGTAEGTAAAAEAAGAATAAGTGGAAAAASRRCSIDVRAGLRRVRACRHSTMQLPKASRSSSFPRREIRQWDPASGCRVHWQEGVCLDLDWALRELSSITMELSPSEPLWLPFPFYRQSSHTDASTAHHLITHCLSLSLLSGAHLSASLIMLLNHGLRIGSERTGENSELECRGSGRREGKAGEHARWG
jgi:hypothetical protein